MNGGVKMERAIAEMEKIRRAEEIYSRRKNADEEERGFNTKNIYKKMFEVLFLINVVIIIVAVQNQKYIFTEQFLNQMNSYNVNIKKKIEEIFSKNPVQSAKTNNSAIDSSKNKTEENKIEENSGVSGESNDVNSALVENESQVQNGISQNLTQEEQDALEIKNNYSVILPITGIKTSGFGERESSNSKVTKYHTGVDIAADTGTVIKSAISGKVIQVSSAR